MSGTYQVLHQSQGKRRHLLPKLVHDRLQREDQILVLDLVHQLEELVQKLGQDGPQQVQVCKKEQPLVSRLL
jgi:hypothetical protein